MDNVELEKREIYGNDVDINDGTNDGMPEDDMDMPDESKNDLSIGIGLGLRGLVLIALVY